MLYLAGYLYWAIYGPYMAICGPDQPYMAHIWPIYGHIWSIYGPCMNIYGPYLAIYGPYMAIYVPYMTIYGPYMAIYGPYMAIHDRILKYFRIISGAVILNSNMFKVSERFLLKLLVFVKRVGGWGGWLMRVLHFFLRMPKNEPKKIMQKGVESQI